MDKYMVSKDELLKNEGKTVQSTYKAIDDMQIRAEQKMLRKYYRQQRRLARINNRGYYTYSYNPYNYYNPYVYNYGYGYNYGYPPYTYKPYCGLNTAVNTAFLGLGLYWLLK